jgi:hypothetical protein
VARGIQLAWFSLAGSVAVLLYLGIAPRYQTAKLREPLSLETTKLQRFEFSVEQNDSYLLEVVLGVDPESPLGRRIVGNLPEGTRGSVKIPWTLSSPHGVLQFGGEVPSEFTPSRLGAVLVGNPRLEPGVSYVLDIELREVVQGADRLAPTIQVALHPAKAERRLVSMTVVSLWAAASLLLLVGLHLSRWRTLRNDAAV